MSDVQTDNTMALYHALNRIDELEAQNEALRQQLQQMMTAELKTAVDYAEVFILRKQAEAVEAARDEICDFRGELWNAAQPDELTDYANRLRQQADELENDTNAETKAV